MGGNVSSGPERKSYFKSSSVTSGVERSTGSASSSNGYTYASFSSQPNSNGTKQPFSASAKSQSKLTTYALPAPEGFVPGESAKDTKQQVMDQDQRDSSDNIIKMFKSNPKHLGSGLLTAGRDVSIGVAAGVGTFVAAPVAGGMQHGVLGVLKGTGLGLGALVALPIAGVTSAVVQIGRGM